MRRSALGGAFFGINVALFASAVQRTSVAEVTLISSFQPVLVLLVAGPLFGERAGRREIGLIAAALVVSRVTATGRPFRSSTDLTGPSLRTSSLVPVTKMGGENATCLRRSARPLSVSKTRRGIRSASTCRQAYGRTLPPSMRP